MLNKCMERYKNNQSKKRKIKKASMVSLKIVNTQISIGGGNNSSSVNSSRSDSSAKHKSKGEYDEEVEDEDEDKDEVEDEDEDEVEDDIIQVEYNDVASSKAVPGRGLKRALPKGSMGLNVEKRANKLPNERVIMVMMVKLLLFNLIFNLIMVMARDVVARW